MTDHLALRRVSTRAMIIAVTVGSALSILSLNYLWVQNPNGHLHGPEGVAWSSLAIIAAITFVLGAGGTLSLYIACRFLITLLSGRED